MLGLKKEIVLWHSLRTLIFARICIHLRKRLQAKSMWLLNKTPKLLTLIALLLGAVVYNLVSWLFDKFLCACFSMRKLRPLDEFFLCPRYGTPNAGAMFQSNNVPFEQCKNAWRWKFIQNFDKMKVKFTSVCGRYFWRDMPEKEFNQKFNESFERVQGIHTREELQQFCSEKLSAEIDIQNSLPWKFWYIEGYSAESSYVLFLAHHALTDGVQFIGAMMTSSDNLDLSKFKNIKGVSPIEKTVGYILSPFYALKLAVNQMLLAFDENCFKKKLPEVPDRRLIMTDEYDRDMFTKSCKLYKCSFSEATFGVIGQAIQDYQIFLKSDKVADVMKFSTTINLRKMPTKPEEVAMGNYFVPWMMPIKTSDNLQDNIKYSRAENKKVMGGLNLVGQQTLVQYLLMLPFNIGSLLLDDLSKRRTFQFTSVPGPKQPISIGGVEHRNIYGLLPFIGDQAFGLASCSCANSIVYALVCDTHYLKHPEKFMQFLHERMKQFMMISQPQFDEGLILQNKEEEAPNEKKNDSEIKQLSKL